MPTENNVIPMVLLVNMHLIWPGWVQGNSDNPLITIENNVIPIVLLVNMHLITNINNSLSWTKQAVEVKKKRIKS